MPDKPSVTDVPLAGSIGKIGDTLIQQQQTEQDHADQSMPKDIDALFAQPTADLGDYAYGYGQYR